MTATYNGEWIDTSETVVDDNEKFSINLQALNLNENDQIQVYLRDNEGSAIEAGVMNPPKTNNLQGNINPTETMMFHDSDFEL